MPFIVLETVGGAEFTTISVDKDGCNAVFATHEEALKELDEVQEGLIVEIP